MQAKAQFCTASSPYINSDGSRQTSFSLAKCAICSTFLGILRSQALGQKNAQKISMEADTDLSPKLQSYISEHQISHTNEARQGKIKFRPAWRDWRISVRRQTKQIECFQSKGKARNCGSIPKPIEVLRSVSALMEAIQKKNTDEKLCMSTENRVCTHAWRGFRRTAQIEDPRLENETQLEHPKTGMATTERYTQS